MNELPIGTEVHCKYLDYEFNGRIVRGGYSQYLVEVYRGTGHKNENDLHNGPGRPGDCWFFSKKHVKELYPEYQYDPSQAGDTEEDI